MKKVDENKAMVVSQTKEVKHHADELSKVLGKHKSIESWVVGKIERASTDLSDVTHYLDGKKYAKGGGVGDFKNDGHGNYTNDKGYSLIDQFDGTYEVLDANGMDIVGEYISLEDGKRAIKDYMEENEKYSNGGGVGLKEMTLYKIETLSKGSKDVLTDREDNLYIYEKGVLYDTEDGNKKGTSHRMSKINLTILPFTKYAKGGEVEDKKKSILNYINTFPNKPKDWSEATDELPTIHKEMAEIYTDKGNKYDFDFTKRSSLEERNLRHKKGIKFLLNKFSDKDINDVYNSYYHWFKYQYENGGELNNNCEYTIGGL